MTKKPNIIVIDLFLTEKYLLIIEIVKKRK
jgi:hypothetical protein